MTQEEFDALMGNEERSAKKMEAGGQSVNFDLNEGLGNLDAGKEDLDDLKEASGIILDIKKTIQVSDKLVDKQIELLEVLKKKFPNVKRFDGALDDVKGLKSNFSDLALKSQEVQDKIKSSLEANANKNTNGQKIEQILNVINVLSGHLKDLVNDKDVKDVVDKEDIERFINSFEK
ncbi:MAG: hypothetical protein CR967_03215 [Proteobacteria bacterium]|nr:MAG: hypothetical protein CR967_03215 [Pseudomonadota bacterium]